MPEFTITEDLHDPAASLTDGAVYTVQNQGGALVRLVVAASAVTAKTTESLILAGLANPNTNGPSHMELTYAATKHYALWTPEGESRVVFMEL